MVDIVFLSYKRVTVGCNYMGQEWLRRQRPAGQNVDKLADAGERMVGGGKEPPGAP